MRKNRNKDSWPEGIINLPPGSGKTGMVLIQYGGVQLTAPPADSHAAQNWLRSHQNDSVHQIDCHVSDRINYLRTGPGLVVSSPKTQTSRITPPPGFYMQKVADFLCSKKTRELLVKPILADMQHEYFEALSQHRTRKACMIRARYFLNLCMALGLMRVLKVLTDVLRTVNFR
jgi:hypothetical protein